MNDLTEAEVKTAMGNGALYFSYEPGGSNSGSPTYGQATTPTLTDVVVSGSSITISGGNYTSIAWYDDNTSVVGTAAAINVSAINSKFVRAVLTNANGLTYTQPFGIGINESQFCEGFETGWANHTRISDNGQPSGTQWFAAPGPYIEDNIGVGGTWGVDNHDNIFTWTAHPFDWNAVDFTGLNIQMDFQTNGSGDFDDDRVGWMKSATSTSSNHIFGIQLDNASNHLRMEGYWDHNVGDDIRVEMANLDGVSITANGWYRLIAQITRLSATSARIEGELWSLDGSGNPVSMIASGVIANTDLVGATNTPNPAYFTGPIWPAYKNYSSISGAADNACFEVLTSDQAITITGTPLNSFSSTPGNPSAEQNYTVEGSGLTDDIIITAPTDFEVSTTSGSGFGSSVVLTESGGTVSSTTIYVRFNRATTGTSSGNITHTSTGVTTQNVAVSGTALPPSGVEVCEDYQTFTVGNNVGSDSEWFDGGNGPVIGATNGVTGSRGLSAANNIFTWTAYPFNWNAADVTGLNAQMDFKTDGSGQFDDDRIGWMITNSDVGSTNFFGVQLDHIDGGIVTYWRNSSGTRIQTQIVDISSTSANTWYRFSVEITKLGATEASLDVSLVELDGSGNPTGVPYTGTVTSTLTWPGGAPDTKYFTASTIWPAYKNYTAAGAEADNACFEVLANVLTPTISVTSNLGNYPFHTVAGTPSDELSYTVSGSNLEDDITITPPTGFEISTTSGSGLGISVVLSDLRYCIPNHRFM